MQESLQPHPLGERQREPACTDNCRSGDHIGQEAQLEHLPYELQDLPWTRALADGVIATSSGSPSRSIPRRAAKPSLAYCGFP